MTNSSTATATEKILKLNDPAPFYGVLSDEKTYRAYKADQKLSKNLEGENAILSLKVEVIQRQNDELMGQKRSVWGWFTFGAVVGLLAGVLASK